MEDQTEQNQEQVLETYMGLIQQDWRSHEHLYLGKPKYCGITEVDELQKPRTPCNARLCHDQEAKLLPKDPSKILFNQ